MLLSRAVTPPQDVEAPSEAILGQDSNQQDLDEHGRVGLGSWGGGLMRSGYTCTAVA